MNVSDGLGSKSVARGEAVLLSLLACLLACSDAILRKSEHGCLLGSKSVARGEAVLLPLLACWDAILRKSEHGCLHVVGWMASKNTVERQ